MSLANHGENLVLNWAFTDASVTRPTAWYVALNKDDPGETGANEVTVSDDADYLRKSITFADAASGAVASESSVTWTIDSASSGFTIRGVSIWDAASSGNCLAAGLLYSSHAVVANDVITFAIGDLTVTLD
jgi:hypothetical protein